MPSIDSFPTKRGVATVEDGVVIVEESYRNRMRSLYHNYWRSDAWWRKLIFVSYAFAPLYAFGILVAVFRQGDFVVLAGLLLLLALVRFVYYVRGFRSPNRLPLEQVKAINATRGEKGLTRPRIDLTYRDDGSTYKRRLNLPSLYTPDGDRVFEQAVEAFRERGFNVA